MRILLWLVSQHSPIWLEDMTKISGHNFFLTYKIICLVLVHVPFKGQILDFGAKASPQLMFFIFVVVDKTILYSALSGSII